MKLDSLYVDSYRDDKNFKGRNCSKLGDTVIAAEVMGKEDICVCSSNKKDFEPICESLDISSLVPDYS